MPGMQLTLKSFQHQAPAMPVLWRAPITRDGFKGPFGREISRNLIGRLYTRDLIATGPRAPRRGAPYTFVTTEQFLVTFGLESLRDLPDREQMEDAGIAGAAVS